VTVVGRILFAVRHLLTMLQLLVGHFDIFIPTELGRKRT
jgi:hypothetical protein